MANSTNRLIIIGDNDSLHIKYWHNYLNQKHEIFLIKSHAIKTKTSFKSWFRLFLEIKKIRPSVICVHYVTIFSLPLVILRTPKIVLHAYGSDFYWLKSQKKKTLKDIITKYILQLLLKRANKILLSSEALSKFLQESYKAQKNKIKVISWGIELDKIKPDANAKFILNKFGIPAGKEIFLCTRAFQALHNHLNLIKAFGKFVIENENKNYHLVLTCSYGDKTYFNFLQEHLRKLKIKDSITLNWGYLGFEELSFLLKNTKLYFSLPDTDQLSASLLEAMYMGCFPVVSNIAAYREIIRDGFNGFFTDQKNETAIVDSICRALVLIQHHTGYKMFNRDMIMKDHSRQVQAEKMYREIIA